MRDLMEALGASHRATDRWEAHVGRCKTCDQSRPAMRCRKGIGLYQEMADTFREAQAAELELTEREAESRKDSH